MSYQIQCDTTQLRTICNALDLYMRIGMGQLEICEEQIRYTHDIRDDNLQKIRDSLTAAKGDLGLAANSSYGIASSKTLTPSKISADLLSVFRKQIAEDEDLTRYSVWHHGPIIHHAPEVPLATITRGERCV